MPSATEVWVYADVVCDLFHAGHVSFLEKARALGDRLIVGVVADEDVATYKPVPICTWQERHAVVAACRHVDAILPHPSPLVPTPEFLDEIGASFACHGDDLSAEDLEFFYGKLMPFGRHRTVSYTAGVSTRSIVERVRGRLSDSLPIDSAGISQVGDPFGSVWDDESRGRIRSLLGRTTQVASSLGIELFLIYGTLLGHVREGQILPWDDDLDLALFAGRERYRLLDGLAAAGLGAIFDRWQTERQYPAVDQDGCIKVFDPGYSPIGGHFGGTCTWPYVDVYVYEESGGILFCNSYHDGNPPLAASAALPGRVVQFEQAEVWEPELPPVVLDTQYPTWRTREISSSWCHRVEGAIELQAERAIRTDARGRRVGRGGDLDDVRSSRERE